MALVDPLLATGRRRHDPLKAHRKSRQVPLLQLLRHALHRAELAVEILQLIHHLLIPQTRLLQVAHQERIQYDELARQIAFYEQVLVGRLDAGRGRRNVGDRRRRRDRQHIGVPHPVSPDFFAQRRPVHPSAPRYFHRHTPFLLEEIDGVLRHNPPIPLGTAVAGVGSLLRRQVAGSLVSKIRDRLHHLVVELHRRLRSKGQPLHIKGVLQSHHA